MNRVTRRLFMQGGAALVAAHAVGARSEPVVPARIPIGVQLYSVAAELQKDVPGTLHQIRAIGYQRVETAGLAGLTAKAFREQLDAAQLVCLSSHRWNNEELEPFFAEANTLGSHYVVTSGGVPQGSATLDDYSRLASQLNELGRKAQAAGLQYAYHNHNFEFRPLSGDKFGYDLLLQQTDANLVKLELDCGWMISAGHNPIDYFRRYPGRYKMLHIKDFHPTQGPSTSLEQSERPQGTELGRGHIDYKPILLAAQKDGIYDYFVEQEPPFPDMPALEAMKVDYQYLRAL